MTTPAELPKMTKLFIRCEFADGHVYEIDVPEPVHPEIALSTGYGSELSGAAGPVLAAMTYTAETYLPAGYSGVIKFRVNNRHLTRIVDVSQERR